MKNLFIKLGVVFVAILSNSCSTNPAEIMVIFKDTIIQGFHGVVHHDTTWMKNYLNVDTFSNGDPIPTAKNENEWSKACEEKKPVKAFANFDLNKHAIYNLYAVLDGRHIAPRGWKIPSENDVDRILRIFSRREVIRNRNYSKNPIKPSELPLPNYYLIAPEKWKNNWFRDDSLHFGHNSYLNLTPTKRLSIATVSFSGTTEYFFYPEKDSVKIKNEITMYPEAAHFWWFNDNNENVGFFELTSNAQVRELEKENFSYNNSIVFDGKAIKCVATK